MDIERALISKALQTGELSELVARGIEPDHFADDEIADLYDWAIGFMVDYAGPPSMHAARAEFPDFKPLLSQEPWKWHVQQFERKVKERLALELIRDYHDHLDDPNAIDEIEIHAQEMARRLTEVMPGQKARHLSEGMLRKQEYDQRKKKNIVLGMPLGIKTFDDITLGVQSHELVIWGGPPGGGKTTGLQFSMINAYTQSGATGLFISLEVEGDQILRKFDTMLSNIEYHALKALTLDKEQERKWTEVLERVEKDKAHRDIIIIDDIKNCTVDKVAAQQIRYKPDIIAVDYLEEMRTPRGTPGWEGVAENGRALKQQARTTHVPCLTATQLNREGETAYQSAQKIADMLIVIEPPDEDDPDPTEINLFLRKYRDGPSRKKVRMRWKLDTMDIGELGVVGSTPRLGSPFAARKPVASKRKPTLAELQRRRRNGKGS